MIENVNMYSTTKKKFERKDEREELKRILKKLQDDDEMDYVDFLGLTEIDKNTMSTYGNGFMLCQLQNDFFNVKLVYAFLTNSVS